MAPIGRVNVVTRPALPCTGTRLRVCTSWTTTAFAMTPRLERSRHVVVVCVGELVEVLAQEHGALAEHRLVGSLVLHGAQNRVFGHFTEARVVLLDLSKPAVRPTAVEHAQHVRRGTSDEYASLMAERQSAVLVFGEHDALACRLEVEGVRLGQVDVLPFLKVHFIFLKKSYNIEYGGKVCSLKQYRKARVRRTRIDRTVFGILWLYVQSICARIK